MNETKRSLQTISAEIKSEEYKGEAADYQKLAHLRAEYRTRARELGA